MPYEEEHFRKSLHAKRNFNCRQIHGFLKPVDKLLRLEPLAPFASFFHRGARGTALRSAFRQCTPGVTGCARTWNTHHSQLQCNWEVLLIQQQVEHIQTKDLIPEQIFYLNILVLFTFFAIQLQRKQKQPKILLHILKHRDTARVSTTQSPSSPMKTILEQRSHSDHSCVGP